MLVPSPGLDCMAAVFEQPQGVAGVGLLPRAAPATPRDPIDVAPTIP